MVGSAFHHRVARSPARWRCEPAHLALSERAWRGIGVLSTMSVLPYHESSLPPAGHIHRPATSSASRKSLVSISGGEPGCRHGPRVQQGGRAISDLFRDPNADDRLGLARGLTNRCHLLSVHVQRLLSETMEKIVVLSGREDADQMGKPGMDDSGNATRLAE